MRKTYMLTLLFLASLCIGCGSGEKAPTVLPAAEQQAVEEAYTQEAEAAMAAEAAEQAANPDSE